ncbi:MAG: MotA/TolQ/ExbB proton channel family protein [Bacteroidales bacterium]|nr:MotA/TolQ/ExbB proton channel family protein [Bacteroidales bacterium]
MMAPVFAQEAEAEVSKSFHQVLKDYFIDGGPGFMSLVAIALVLGVAFVVERIIYLNLSEINAKKLVAKVEDALEANNVDEAIEIAKKTRGPIAAIYTQALLRLKDGQSLEDIDKAVTSYGALQSGYLEKNLSWITLFIAAAPSLGFLGTAVGMVQAFDDIVKAGDISPTVVASGMKVALITTIGGIIVALVLQIFYNYLLSKVEAIVSDMEDASISLMDAVIKYSVKK